MKSLLYDAKELRKPQNILSLSRIPLSFVMVALVFVDKWWFLGLLLLIGLTDLLDGIVARARKEASSNGAWFDSFADHIFYPLLFLSTYFLASWLFADFWLPLLLIVLWWIGNFIVMRTRFGKVVFIHLQSVRLTVTLYVLFTVLLVIGWHVETAFVILMIIWGVRLAEETFVYLTMKKIDPDIRWFWQVK